MKQNYFENADWIFVDCDGSQVCDEYFEYCTSFEISSVSKTTLSLCSYSQYAVYINGTFVNCGQYDGYEDYQVYDTLDITQHLQVGKINYISVIMYVAPIFPHDKSKYQV